MNFRFWFCSRLTAPIPPPERGGVKAVLLASLGVESLRSRQTEHRRQSFSEHRSELHSFGTKYARYLTVDQLAVSGIVPNYSLAATMHNESARSIDLTSGH